MQRAAHYKAILPRMANGTVKPAPLLGEPEGARPPDGQIPANQVRPGGFTI